MSKTIWLKDETYNKLEALREKRETFGEVVERLIKVYDVIWDVSEALGPGHYLKERPQEQLDAITAARLVKSE